MLMYTAAPLPTSTYSSTSPALGETRTLTLDLGPCFTEMQHLLGDTINDHRRLSFAMFEGPPPERSLSGASFQRDFNNFQVRMIAMDLERVSAEAPAPRIPCIHGRDIHIEEDLHRATWFARTVADTGLGLRYKIRVDTTRAEQYSS